MKIQKILLVGMVLILTACATVEDKKTTAALHFAHYSASVKDTFYIDVQLPKEYEANPHKKYPTLVFVDGNFYFPMMSAVLHQYEVAGLLEPFIVVGIGYKSFQEMDSLRTRDYLYPAALPSDELNASGGGEHFYNYITTELLPKIDSGFRTEPTDRTLLGHSFGGYFVLYSLLQQSTHQSNAFKHFISASPSVWYNDFYLTKQTNQLVANDKSIGLYLSVGALEDSTWQVNPIKRLANELQKKKKEELDLKIRIFNHLDHMDVPLVTFNKGIQELRARN
jgi:predicted alpha/beta superfamily hydrolase